MPLHVFLLYALLVSNVALRLFTNKIPILPKALNIADVFITICLVFLSLRYTHQPHGERSRFSLGKSLFLFNLVLASGAILNLTFFHPPAALSQFIMWNEPLLLFWAVSQLPFTEQHLEGFRRLLVRLVVVEFVLGLFQVPIYMATGETESIIGTFYGNAEQYQGFIMLGVFYLVARQQLEPWNSRKLWMMVGVMLCLIVVIDNKASWLGVMVSIFLVVHFQGRGGTLWFLRPRYVLPLVLLFGLAGLLYKELSPSKGKLQGLVDAWRSDNFKNLGKIKAYDDILHAFEKHLHMAVVGSGPGNFYSRSGTQFYLMGAALARPDAPTVRVWSSRTSNSMGGVISLTTKPPFYAQFYVNREIYRIGSGQVDSPFSSYAALLGETGFIGTLLYLSIYFRLLRRLLASVRECYRFRPGLYPFANAALGLTIYMMTDSGYNNWLETGRITTIAWAMAALLLKPVPVLAHAEVVEEESAPQAANSSVYTAP